MTTKQTNDGGPAFPTANGDFEIYMGMTLRDWFAGMALQGMLSRFAYDEASGGNEFQAAKAYRMADAMLAERNK